MTTLTKKALIITVVVSALGYFVDIYDLLLFGIVRIPSLKDLNVPQDQMLTVGLKLLNMQMVGMLIGGILWGVTGDKRGRRSVLFGSILLYSIANIANAFVVDVDMYLWLRFFAGIGLAGELGAAITLVSEVLPKEKRGYGTSIVACVGILGAVAASLIGDAFSWKTAYLVGGCMGFCLLLLRAGLLESTMFDHIKNADTKKGHFHELFLNKSRLVKYLSCIFIGIPIWFIIGVLITFAPELTKELHVNGIVTGSKSIMWCYVGGSTGDLISGLLSQYFSSRKKIVLAFLAISMTFIITYLFSQNITANSFYVICLALGFATGYWAIFVTIAAEQFGTNLRATVSTTVPNFVRGSVVPITYLFQYLKTTVGIIHSALILGGACIILATVALYFLRETFGKDLNYLEQF